MKEYIKEHFFQFISLIPVCFIAVGAFVLNTYLYQFGIIDIALFDSKTIFVGFVAVLQIVCYFFLFCTFFGDVGMKYGFKLYIVNMLWKPVLFTIIIYSFLGNENKLRQVYSGWRFNFLWLLMSISIIGFIGLVCLHSEKNIANLKTKKDKRIFESVTFIELFSTYSVYSILIKDRVFQEMCETYMSLSAVCVIFAIVIVYKKFPLINKEKETSFFRLGDKPIQIDYYCAYFIIIIFLMVALALYSTRVFPHISNNLGGGFYKFNTIVLNDDSFITGKIIYNNSNYVYIMENENQLSQYPIEKIKSYVISEKSNVNSNSYETPFFEIVEENLDLCD